MQWRNSPRRGFFQCLLLLPPLVLLVAAGTLLVPQRGSAEEEGKVSLELYYESLCPYCSRFIVNHLTGIFQDGLIDAVNLRLVPYGNARIGSNSKISCQGAAVAYVADMFSTPAIFVKAVTEHSGWGEANV